MTSWQIIESGQMDPISIMTKDAQLLAGLDPDGSPLLHFYEWSVPCLTYGYFTDPSCHLDLQALEGFAMQLARRPTGGGIIFHLTDFAFSLLIPAGHAALSQNTLENYALINRHVANAIAALSPLSVAPELVTPSVHVKPTPTSFCMAAATPYDLVIQGKKVGGAAQRRTKTGLLHQATLSLCPLPSALLNQVLKDQQCVASICENSFYLCPSENDLETYRRKIKELVRTNIEKNL